MTPLMEGILAHQRGEFDKALAIYTRIAAEQPQNPHPLYFGALSAYQLKRYDPANLERAQRMMLRSLQLDPSRAEAWYNLGKFHHDAHDLATAVQYYTAAVEQRADFPEALINCGNIHFEFGDYALAEECYRRAQNLIPSTAEGRYNLSFLYFTQGKMAEGFEAQEARFDCPAYMIEYGRPWHDKVPRWSGQPIPGTLLVHGEQGHGDVIQVLRYVPMVEAVQPRVILEVLRPLVPLVRAAFPHLEVHERDRDLPAFESHVYGMSLPYLFGGVISAPSLGCLDLWRDPGNIVPRIGICWAGSKDHPNDKKRSLPFATIAPLLDYQRVQWLSLQVGERSVDLHQGQRYPWVIDHTSELTDFLETAKLLRTLDLVITCDTSVAHLAGALGVPTWLLVPHLPDYRWQLHRTDSIWYPSLTLWRQPRADDWPTVIHGIREALEVIHP